MSYTKMSVEWSLKKIALFGGNAENAVQVNSNGMRTAHKTQTAKQHDVILFKLVLLVLERIRTFIDY